MSTGATFHIHSIFLSPSHESAQSVSKKELHAGRLSLMDTSLKLLYTVYWIQRTQARTEYVGLILENRKIASRQKSVVFPVLGSTCKHASCPRIAAM
jgi:hypothetical protein